MSGKIKQLSRFNRRSFLKNGILTAGFVGLNGIVNVNGQNRPTAGVTLADDENFGKAKNIIFLISDGMSMGTLSMTDQLLRRKEGRVSNWIRLYEEQKAIRGLMDMTSLNSIVTDSAAAAASWGCGKRVNNNAINMSPEGIAYDPILKIFKENGKATGCVTTTRITHATPAGFTANVSHRGDEDHIAEQYAERKYDIMMGGGSRHFNPELREDRKDIYGLLKASGFHVVKNKIQMLALPEDNSPVLATFSHSHLPYSLDQIADSIMQNEIPTLAEMTDFALKRLSKNENGFILQVEGGRVDHAAHANDIGGLLHEQIAFDNAIEVAQKFAEADQNTLVIITTDHGNANPGLNGEGEDYSETNRFFDNTFDILHSNTWILEGLNKKSKKNEIRDRVEFGTSIKISKEDAEFLQLALRDQYRPVYRHRWEPYATLGEILSNYTSIVWSGNQHTSDYVEVAAFGPGSEMILPFMKNTQMFDLMLQAAALTTDH